MPGMRRRATVVGMATLAVTMLAPASAALAAPGDACDNRSNNTYQKLLECMTVDGVREHQAEFQKIAENNTDSGYGTREPQVPPGTGQRRLRRRAARGRRVQRDAGSGRDHVQLPGRPAPAHAGRRRVRDRCLLRQWRGRRHGRRRPGRHRPHAAAGVHEWLRGAYTEAAVGEPIVADFDRAGRLSGSRRRIALIQRGTCFFATQGVQRRGGRCLGRHHLQPGQHAGARGRPSRTPKRGRRPEGSAGTHHEIPVVGAASRTAPPWRSRVRRRSSR